MLDIISITRNDVAGIQRTVASTGELRQRPDVRHIIIDSSDEPARATVAALAAEAAVRYAWTAPHGISAAFNEGIRLSTGRWLWFLNGGDTTHPSLNTDLFLALLARSTSDTMQFQMEFRGKIFSHPPLHELWPPYVNYWLHHQAFILTRQVVLDNDGFLSRFRIAMDLDLWLRMFLRGARADVISFPIAIFMDDGVSQDDRRRYAEQAQVLRVHAFALFKRWVRNGLESVGGWYGSWRRGRG